MTYNEIKSLLILSGVQPISKDILTQVDEQLPIVEQQLQSNNAVDKLVAASLLGFYCRIYGCRNLSATPSVICEQLADALETVAENFSLDLASEICVKFSKARFSMVVNDISASLYGVLDLRIRAKYVEKIANSSYVLLNKYSILYLSDLIGFIDIANTLYNKYYQAIANLDLLPPIFLTLVQDVCSRARRLSEKEYARLRSYYPMLFWFYELFTKNKT